MIYEDLEYEQEADIFANQMKYVKPLNPYEVFMANIEAGNDKQVIIKSLVESYRLTIGKQRGNNVICAVSSLESIFDKYGYHVLDRVLRLCVATWEGDMNSFSANIINGLARIIVAYGDSIRDDVFKEKVGALSVKALTRNAKERRAGSLGFAEAMMIAYNFKCKYKLSLSRLYSKGDYEPTDDEFEDEERLSIFDNVSPYDDEDDE